MALSNWATLAIHSDKGLVDGTFKQEDAGFDIQIYKSKIHIYDEHSFREDNGFKGGLVARIEEGQARYFDVHIDVWKPQSNEVYVAMKKGYRHNNTYEGFIGCGVYGYSGEEWVGVTRKQAEKLREHAGESDKVRLDEFTIPQSIEYNQGDKAILERTFGGDIDSDELYNREEEPVFETILDLF